MYAFNNSVKHLSQNWYNVSHNWYKSIHKSITIIGDLNIPFPITDRSNRNKKSVRIQLTWTALSTRSKEETYRGPTSTWEDAHITNHLGKSKPQWHIILYLLEWLIRDYKCWQGCGEKGTTLHCCENVNWYSHYGK